MISNAARSTIAAIIGRHRALAVLRILLSEDCNGSSNDGVLGDALDALGLGCARSTLRACLDRLERSGLVTLTPLDGLVVARLTRDGAEVAEGRLRVEGVQPFVAGGPY